MAVEEVKDWTYLINAIQVCSSNIFLALVLLKSAIDLVGLNPLLTPFPVSVSAGLP
jgi:hypothetical protein